MSMVARSTSAAESGRRGADIRSDCWVRIQPTDSGGIQLQLKSKVEAMYGDAIRRQVGHVLADLGVGHARVELEDAGALPWVIAARLEAAVRRFRGAGPQPAGKATMAGLGGAGVGAVLPVREHLPRWSPGARYGTTRERFRRSRLYLPGNEPKFMLNAGLHRPDGIILDLEDSVAPACKDEARTLVRNALRSVDFCGAERMVRINQGGRGMEDLDYIVPHNVHVVLIPKVEDAEQVREIDARIKQIFKERRPNDADAAGEHAALLRNDTTPARVFLMPIIESARGVLNAREIASACESVVALTIGLEDYTADIGTARTVEGRESLWARCMIVNAARAAGIPPIDSVFSDVDDETGLRASVQEAKALGFEGKGCIHPRQIRVIHEAFAPTREELEKSLRIVAAFEEAQARGLGVVALGSKMIDPPVVKRAQRIVRLAEELGL